MTFARGQIWTWSLPTLEDSGHLLTKPRVDPFGSINAKLPEETGLELFKTQLEPLIGCRLPIGSTADLRQRTMTTNGRRSTVTTSLSVPVGAEEAQTPPG